MSRGNLALDAIWEEAVIDCDFCTDVDNCKSIIEGGEEEDVAGGGREAPDRGQAEKVLKGEAEGG